MKKIQMVDLVSQTQKIQSTITDSWNKILQTGAFIGGDEVNAFSKELETFLGNSSQVIPCANGTDALQIALMALDLKPGDEVITADFTFAATVEVIHLLGLTSVLVDVDPETFLMDPKRLEAAITDKTKAIIPVHLFGQCAPMEEILHIAKKHDLFVIEDTAQAIGAEYTFTDGSAKKAGTMGTIGTTSFFPSKNLGCFGDGGAIFTGDDKLAHIIRGIANHGMYQRYYHDVVGVNSRLDALQASVLRAKLPLLPEYNKARQEAARVYSEGLSGVKELKTPSFAANSTHVFHQYTLQVLNGKRDELQAFLASKDIPAMIYYPVALRKQKAYDTGNYNDAEFPVTDDLITKVISLPMHTELDSEQQNYIIDNIKAFFHENN
ncbi:MAG: transcriptional regulator [Flavobacteriaceae bacterium]|nr:MAG: transcriptional regulator [Flavobacteriaceae bacterium]